MNVDMRKFVIDWETGKVKYIDHGVDLLYQPREEWVSASFVPNYGDDNIMPGDDDEQR